MARPLSFAFMVTALLVARASAVPVTLSLKPASTSGVQADDIVSLELWAESSPPGQGVLAVQAFITFDPAHLSVVDTLGDPVDPLEGITPGPGWDVIFANYVGPVPPESLLADLLAGEIFFSAGRFSVPELLTDMLVASFSVKALDNFVMTSLSLPDQAVSRPPFFYQNRVSDLSNFDITGSLEGAILYGTQTGAIPEPLTMAVLGLGLGLLAHRRRRFRLTS